MQPHTTVSSKLHFRFSQRRSFNQNDNSGAASDESFDKMTTFPFQCVCELPWYQGSWGQHGAHLGPTGPRWAPCWPHEPCCLGCVPEVGFKGRDKWLHPTVSVECTCNYLSLPLVPAYGTHGLIYYKLSLLSQEVTRCSTPPWKQTCSPWSHQLWQRFGQILVHCFNAWWPADWNPQVTKRADLSNTRSLFY